MKADPVESVQVTIGNLHLPGLWQMPKDAKGVVVFAHGSGSSRLSPRNQLVATDLYRRGCATLLFDLLTEGEAMDRRFVFDIPKLADRMLGATKWLKHHTLARHLPIAYFGASTGAAAALVAAAELGASIASVVSRGGRPDLAGESLPAVTAPTMLLVGGMDGQVIELNRQAQAKMSCDTSLEIIPGASHLFSEPGTLEQVCAFAGQWCVDHFRG